MPFRPKLIAFCPTERFGLPLGDAVGYCGGFNWGSVSPPKWDSRFAHRRAGKLKRQTFVRASTRNAALPRLEFFSATMGSTSLSESCGSERVRRYSGRPCGSYAR